MENQNIPYRKTGFFSSLVLDYLEQDPKLDNFYTYKPQISSFPEIIRNARLRKINREVLVDALLLTYSHLDPLRKDISPAVNKSVLDNIHSLKDENTFTISCGHQLNLFTGPLFTIFKIFSTIRLAETVQKENPGVKIVPLFWMATEDHDFEEINHVQINGKNLKWDEAASGATGRIATAGIKTLVSQFLSTLGMSDQYESIELLLKSSYLDTPTLAQATLCLFNHLFGRYGLVILNADSPSLKKEFRDIMQRDIEENHSNKLVTESNIALEKMHYSAQVHPREINFFYLEKSIRERIVKNPNGGFEVLNTNKVFSSSQLMELIQHHPDNFSPNVIMRPVYQEKILPNLAFIGGGGEIAYWLSLKSTFDFYRVPFPALFLRNSALLIEEKWGNMIKRLGFQSEDLFQDNRDLIKQYVLRSTTKTLDLNTQKEKIKEVFLSISEQASAIDPTLVQSGNALLTRTLNRLADLEKKMLRKEKNNFDIQISQILTLKQALFPNHSLQERNENIFAFIKDYGWELMDELYNSLNPLDKNFTLITLSSKK